MEDRKFKGFLIECKLLNPCHQVCGAVTAQFLTTPCTPPWPHPPAPCYPGYCHNYKCLTSQALKTLYNKIWRSHVTCGLMFTEFQLWLSLNSGTRGMGTEWDNLPGDDTTLPMCTQGCTICTGVQCTLHNTLVPHVTCQTQGAEVPDTLRWLWNITHNKTSSHAAEAPSVRQKPNVTRKYLVVSAVGWWQGLNW